MHNSSKNKSNRKTISTTLKDGTPITLREYDRFKVRGEVAYSHFMSPLSPKQIERKNELRDKWAESEEHAGPYYHDNPTGVLLFFKVTCLYVLIYLPINTRAPI